MIPKGRLIAIGGNEDKGTEPEPNFIQKNNLNFFGLQILSRIVHEAGGPQILAECEALRRTRYPQGLPTGEAVITSGGLLPARYVIHTVGPVKGVHGEQDAVLLADCYTNSWPLPFDMNCEPSRFPVSPPASMVIREKRRR